MPRSRRSRSRSSSRKQSHDRGQHRYKDSGDADGRAAGRERNSGIPAISSQPPLSQSRRSARILERRSTTAKVKNVPTEKYAGANLHPSVTFESLLEYSIEAQEAIECMEKLVIEDSEQEIRQPDISEEELLSLLLITEPFAKLFACCEVAIYANMRERSKKLWAHQTNRTLVIRLTRVASLLRRSIFRKGRLLGVGSYGRVFLTRTQDSPKEYALKVVQLKTPENADKKIIDRFLTKQVHALRERDTMLMADHPFICKLRASWVEKIARCKLSYMFLLEYAPFGSLRHFIRDRLHKTMPRQLQDVHNTMILDQVESHRANALLINVPSDVFMRRKLIYIYAAEMASGLAYLHRSGIVHRDFKSGNVLIGADYHLRITDFGFVNPHKAYHALQFHSIDLPFENHPAFREDAFEWVASQEQVAGTPGYCYTPELLKKEVTDTNNFYLMDSWALGLVMFELYAGVQPFYAVVPASANIKLMYREIYMWKRNRILNEPVYSAMINDQTYRNLLSRLICDLNNRFTCSEALQLLNEVVMEFTGHSVEVTADSLNFMADVFGPVGIDPSPEFASAWSEEGSVHSAEGMPSIMKNFPYLGGSPRI